MNLEYWPIDPSDCTMQRLRTGPIVSALRFSPAAFTAQGRNKSAISSTYVPVFAERHAMLHVGDVFLVQKRREYLFLAHRHGLLAGLVYQNYNGH